MRLWNRRATGLLDSWVSGNTSEARGGRRVFDAIPMARDPDGDSLGLSRRPPSPSCPGRAVVSVRNRSARRACPLGSRAEHADLSPAPRPPTFDVGQAVVGESEPRPDSAFGSGLFDDYAHLFTVLAPAGSCRDAQHRAALRDVIDAEKPAHTDYHLCLVRSPACAWASRAWLGIDAIVGNGPAPLRLGGTYLQGATANLDDAAPARGRGSIPQRAAQGGDTVIG